MGWGGLKVKIPEGGIFPEQSGSEIGRDCRELHRWLVLAPRAYGPGETHASGGAEVTGSSSSGHETHGDRHGCSAGAVQTWAVGFLEMATLLAWSAFPEVQWLDRAAGGGRSTAL